MSVVMISPRELADRRERGEAIELIDVRTPKEFRERHCTFARNVPLSDLDPQKLPADRPLYVICQSGGRGKQACEKLIHAGRLNVFNVEGGTRAWFEAGLPVVEGPKAMSLERQVRIAAGSLVLLSVILGLFVHPGFFGLSALVGGGLVFAGLTDWCGMGLLIAKMPWNKVSATCSTGVRS